MEENSELKAPEERIYKSRIIEIGTALGGPMVAGYCMAKNFEVFQEPEKAKKAWIYSLGSTILLFGGMFLVPDVEKLPPFIIPVLNAGITSFLVQRFQGEKIEEHVHNGGELYSWGKGISMSLLICVLTVIPVIIIGFFAGDASTTR